ncbi:GNAT family acetyltransferase [Eubacterium sp. MSJ-33]|uniref:GNAT family acetyltransferase n=1 Tax=Eubacterium sp. MSJ-33 TaxID=2841528 RepID=UPI00351D1E25
MIREFQRDDINKVAHIWLDTNIKAHNFIPAEYWKGNFKSVKEALSLAEVYVYKCDTEIQGFIGLNDEYLFIREKDLRFSIVA